MKKSLDCNVTDALIVSDEWENFDYNLRLQIEELANIDYDNKSKEWKENTLASGYLYYVEKLLQEAGMVDNHTINTIKELRKAITNYDSMRIFLQTLRLATIATRAGIIPEMAHVGERHSDTQTEKRLRRTTWNGLTREQLSLRNQEIVARYKKAYEKNKAVTPNSFATQHASEYNLKERQIRNILPKKTLGT
ncbi:MAG: hypothetical protein IMF11_17090 [Proteobacteria bacterium]|nr:hypothetical protein [Pseudomonadota bacterium]